MTYFGLSDALFKELERIKRSIEITPINLGGIVGPSGGVDGRPGGYLGYLPQTRVTYDETELASYDTSVGSPSLYDNLNHIRARLFNIEVSGSDVEDLVDLGDVIITSATSGEILTYNGAIWVNDEGSTVGDLDDLGDVIILSEVSGEVLTYNGSNWINSEGSVVGSLEDLDDVILTTPVSGESLKYDGTNWINAIPSGEVHDAVTMDGTPDYITLAGQVITRNQISLVDDVTGVLPNANVADDITITNITQITNRSHTSLSDIGSNAHSVIDTHIADADIHFDELDELSDVIVTTPASGEVLTYDGSNWINSEGSTVGDIEDLDNVIVTTPASGEVLVYDGTNWVNDTVSGAGGGGSTTLEDLTDTLITSVASGEILEYNGTTWINVENEGGGSSVTLLTFIDQAGGTSDTYGVLSGTINGSNTTFTVSETEYETGSLLVYLNGQLQTQGTSEDWDETAPASGTFDFNTAPISGDEITVSYVYSPDISARAFIDQSGGTGDTYGVLVGLINGSNTTYTVADDSYTSGYLSVYLDGVLQIQGSAEDWVETTPLSGTFDFNTAPPTDSEITVMGGTAKGDADTVDGYHASSFILNSDVDVDIKTLDLPADVTISAFGKTLIDDADASTSRTTLGLIIGTDVLAEQSIGIANDYLVEIDSASVATGEYAKFTAIGLESKSITEVKTDLDILTHIRSACIADPTNYYTVVRPEIPLFRVPAATTITRFHIHGPDDTPTTEASGELRFADDVFTGSFTNATTIDTFVTISGAITVTSGFDDATVPADKYIYLSMYEAPHADWVDLWLEIGFTYD